MMTDPGASVLLSLLALSRNLSCSGYVKSILCARILSHRADDPCFNLKMLTVVQPSSYGKYGCMSKQSVALAVQKIDARHYLTKVICQILLADFATDHRIAFFPLVTYSDLQHSKPFYSSCCLALMTERE